MLQLPDMHPGRLLTAAITTQQADLTAEYARLAETYRAGAAGPSAAGGEQPGPVAIRKHRLAPRAYGSGRFPQERRDGSS